MDLCARGGVAATSENCHVIIRRRPQYHSGWQNNYYRRYHHLDHRRPVSSCSDWIAYGKCAVLRQPFAIQRSSRGRKNPLVGLFTCAALGGKEAVRSEKTGGGSNETLENSENDLACIVTGNKVYCVPNSADSGSDESSSESDASDDESTSALIDKGNATAFKVTGNAPQWTARNLDVLPTTSAKEQNGSIETADFPSPSVHNPSSSLSPSLSTSPPSPPFFVSSLVESAVLVSPFFFWGTSMVAMKHVLPKTGALFIAATRLVPSGLLLLAFALLQGRKMPDSKTGWIAIALFALVDALCFQFFLAEGLTSTSAGLGSVIIDSQPLTVAILASLFFDEALSGQAYLGLMLGVVGLCMLEIPYELLFPPDAAPLSPLLSSASHPLSLLSGKEGQGLAGELWMLLAAQSMAVGTVMVRWVSKHSDPVMATGWHMVLGGLPLLLLALSSESFPVGSTIAELSLVDWSLLFYTSVFGSAVSYGVFFYYANKGNLTRLSSLTFLTPMFAALFGFLFLDESLSPFQLGGALVTLSAISLVNANSTVSKKKKKLRRNLK